MKVLIQARDAELFYQGDGKWTEKRHEAQLFHNSREAAHKCQTDKLQANLLFTFGDPLYDLRIPSS